MDFNYCSTKCPIGKQMSDKLLVNNSALEAAMDFCYFIKECSETCIFKDKIEEEYKL
jgi:hypothetical protein